MTLKKAPGSKRAALPRLSDHTKSFAKDWMRLSHSGRYNMRRLKEVMLLLVANDEQLGAEWSDHQLTGEWRDHRECHIGGEFLLIYKLESRRSNQEVIFVRAGTHAELFE